MAPHFPPQAPNNLNGLNPSSGHRSYENPVLWSSEAASWVNFQPLTGQYPQHGHQGQLDLQRCETRFGREEAQLFRPFARMHDYRDEQLDENQELGGSREMLAQRAEQLQQGGLGQQRDGTIPRLAADFEHQRFQDLQNYQSPRVDFNIWEFLPLQAAYDQRPHEEQPMYNWQSGQIAYGRHAVEVPLETDLSAANKHCPTCSCTQAFVSPKNLCCSSACYRRAGLEPC